MKKLFINLILLFLLICSFGKAIDNYDYLSKTSHTVNIYLNDSKYTPEYFENIYNAEDKEIYSYVPWRQIDKRLILSEDLNRNVEANIFYLYGDSSFLLEGTTLFKDDINGCLIDEDTAYKLFGDIDVKDRKITVDNRVVTVRGINNKYKNTIFLQDISNSKEPMEVLSLEIPSEEGVFNSKDFVNTFIMKYGLDNCTVDSNIYSTISGAFIMIFFFIIVIYILCYTIKKLIKNKCKPVLKVIYMAEGAILILITKIFFKIKFTALINIIPSKWSDFQQWGEIYKENIENFKYFIYAKKYSIDIPRISSTVYVIIYIALSIILFIIGVAILRKSTKKEFFEVK
ncbi:MAG: ABC transporter permease [Clostridiales bacterium]|nr:ABC transporter permease [Clostridiales bacterium]